MKRRTVISLTALAFAAAAMVAAARAQSDALNFAGTWRLDRSSSDDPKKMMGHRGGSWGGLKAENSSSGQAEEKHGGHARGGRGRNPARVNGAHARIPELFTLASSATSFEMKDSTGATVERIVIADSGSVAPIDEKGVPQLRGAWQDQILRVDLVRSGGGTMPQTWELADGGQTLKITTELARAEGDQKQPATFTRVFRKVSGS